MRESVANIWFGLVSCVCVFVFITSLWMRDLEVAVVGTGTALKTERQTGTHTGNMKTHI